MKALILFLVALFGVTHQKDAKQIQYHITASRIVRPSSLYQILVAQFDQGRVLRVSGSISRNGVSVATNHQEIHPGQLVPLILKIPPDNTDGGGVYRVNIEGRHLDRPSGRTVSGPVISHDQELEFNRNFLSITITTNHAVYDATQVLRIRALFLTTSLMPYQGIVDLYFIDPDGYVVRKWNSNELNVGVLIKEFEISSWPKVGFWTIRVVAEGQVEEMKVKIEKHLLGRTETVVSMPTYTLDTEEYIEATVEGTFIVERLVVGDIKVNWYAKKVDYHTPYYNDTAYHKNIFDYKRKIANIYQKNSYNNIGSNNPERSTVEGFMDTYRNESFAPPKPLINKWTYLRSDKYKYKMNEPAEPFLLYLQEIQDRFGTVAGIEVRCEATLTDYFYNETQPAFAETRIISQTLRLEFVGGQPFVFKPGMYFEGRISVMYDDQVLLSKDELEGSIITVEAVTETDDGQFQILETKSTDQDGADLYDKARREQIMQEYRNTGIFFFRWLIPHGTKEVRIKGTFNNDDIGSSETYATAHAVHSPRSTNSSSTFHIQIRHSNIPRVGLNTVFHIKTNFAFKYVDWFVVSKNIIVTSGREVGDNVHQEVKTFSIVVSPEMSPGFHVVATAVVPQHGQVVADSIFIPMEHIFRHEINISTVQTKNHIMTHMETVCSSDPGSIYMTQTMRHATFPAQGITTMTKGLLLQRLFEFDVSSSKRYLNKIILTDREGESPDKVKYFPSNNYGFDARSTYENNDLLFFSSVYDLAESPNSLACNRSQGERPCLKSGCFSVEQECNGITDCLEDGLDEADCRDLANEILEKRKKFRLSRQSRFEDFYDVGDGDWGWFQLNQDHDGLDFVKLEVPETPDDFYFHVFSVSKVNGVGIIDPITYNTVRPVDFYCEAPEEIRRGESVSIRCSLLNRTPEMLESVVILRGSEDYSFIQVESYGYVTSYNPRLTGEDHHHFTWLRGESEMAVLLPIAPHVEMGEFTAIVELSTQITHVIQEVTILVEPEGSLVNRHTSLLLNVKNRANVLRFLNIIVDETPIVPYEIRRRFISGSPRAHLTITGDVVGPVFPDGNPVDIKSIFKGTNQGLFGFASWGSVFTLGFNTWQLHYLRLTNQWEDNIDTIHGVFEFMNTIHMEIMKRIGNNGGLRGFDGSPHNVWLTSWLLRVYSHTSFQDWEDLIYIDPQIITAASMWMLNYQHHDGYFVENETPDIKESRGHYRSDPDSMKENVILTANALIGLEEVSKILQGDAKTFVSTAKQRALAFLERVLPNLTSGYQIAITVLAMTMAKSPNTDLAYAMLLGSSRSVDGMIYWADEDISTNRYRYEFNRPFLEAKDFHEGDGEAVEATAYALITMFMMEGGGITQKQDQAVMWLNTMRHGDGGFVSAPNTLASLQALTLYSYHSRMRDKTDIKMQVELPDSNVSTTYWLTSETMINVFRLDAPNAWGHVNIFAKGRGEAVAQLDVSYGIDYELYKDKSPGDYYNLTINEFFHGRNKSEVTIRACFNWNQPQVESGMTVLAIDIPSGYNYEWFTAIRLIESGVVPELRDFDKKPGKAIWYLDHVPLEQRCLEHTVQRYLPVANLTRTRQAIIFEPYKPERFFIRTFNATSLYILSVCEVCGSYQCPYCPFYSHGDSFISNYFITIVLICLSYFSSWILTESRIVPGSHWN